MRRARGMLAMAILIAAAVFAGCGDSGPEGPDAKFIESMEDMGVSREQAEREAREIDVEVNRESRRQEVKFQRELAQDEKRWARERTGEEDVAFPPAQKSQSPPAETATTGGFTGKYKKRYEEDRIVCGLVPYTQIAKEFGIAASSEPLEVAEAYAEGFYGRFEQAAFEGCFDGIQDREDR